METGSRHLLGAWLSVGTALIASACQSGTAQQLPVQTVRAAAVREVEPDTSERYSATLQPFRQVDLVFTSAGTVERILEVRDADGTPRNVQPGDRVTQGTELARVRTVDYQQRVDQAQAQLTQAEAQRAQVQAVLQQAEVDAARASSLFESASLTRPEFEQSQTRLTSARAQLEAARGAVAAARTTVEQAALALRDTAIVTPFTGWISARHIERGALAGPGAPAFSLVDMHAVRAVFAVPDTSLAKIRQGQRVMVTLDALADPVSGTVTGIASQADPRTHVFSVDVTIPNPGERLRPGMIGALGIEGTAGPGRRRLVVPLGAIVRAPTDASAFAVFRVEQRGDRTFVSLRPVTLGDTIGNAIEVTSGLAAGERIVTLGGELIRDGEEVRVVS